MSYVSFDIKCNLMFNDGYDIKNITIVYLIKMSRHHARLLTEVGQIDAQLSANNKIDEA